MVDSDEVKTTPERLIAAAAAEFREAGFAGTDSNRIARRAGFAPQTFYRWFKDKTEIFIAVYRGKLQRFRGYHLKFRAALAAGNHVTLFNLLEVNIQFVFAFRAAGHGSLLLVLPNENSFAVLYDGDTALEVISYAIALTSLLKCRR